MPRTGHHLCIYGKKLSEDKSWMVDAENDEN
jgi:hypothetical protein